MTSPGVMFAEEMLLDRVPARLHPAPRLSLSEWADTYRILSRTASAEPGQWRTDRAPYQRGIMDAISDPAIERVVFIKPAQVGATEILGNAVGYYMHQDPAPILVVQPTLEMARAWSLDRLKPMLRESPALQNMVHESNRRGSDDTILHKAYPGGHLTIVGANSASGLASRPIRCVFLDEVDRYPASAGDEGDPVTLAAARTETFHNRKIFLGSTPTLKGISRIEAAWEESDQRRYFVPCPHCDHRQTLRWAQLRFADGEPTTYACEGCGVAIEERYKSRMLLAGEWVAARPFRGTAGFHLNALYSPWAQWDELVEKWRRAQGSVTRLQTFVNLVLGETWEDRGGATDPGQLGERAETWPDDFPAEVRAITAGVDVQDNRLEVGLYGWGAGEECWATRHETLFGDPTGTTVWQELDAYLARPWRTADGRTLAITATAIDSGYHTQRVYEFVAPRQARRVFAVKGGSTPGAPVLPRKPTRPTRGGVRLYLLGTDAAKDILAGRLRAAPGGPGTVHLHRRLLDSAYLEQLTGERRVPRQSAGRWYSRWEALPGRRVEALDCWVYAFAALRLLGPAARLETATPPPTPEDAIAPDPVPTDPPLAVARATRPRRPGGWVKGWR